MILTRFRVQNFRSFIDSGWIECLNVTAIAGVNEAGKSNLLRALWKLKPAFRSDNKITHNDLPIDCFDKIMDAEEMPIFITAEFKLRPYDKELIAKKFGSAVNFDYVTVSRYLSGKYKVDYPKKIDDGIRNKLDDFIIKNMPGFIYYSNYGNLDSNIYLPQMLAKFNKSGVNTISKSKRRTVKLLLMYIGITPEMLACDAPVLEQASKTQLRLTADQLHELLVKQERYKKLFKEAGERLSREFNQWWHQGKYKFEFAFDNGNLTIFVTDAEGIRAPLDERSVGMQWFLSFFLVFTLESQLFYTNTIMLLDESGATLHGLAQRDLVDFFDELSKTNQIIYSTHSSFMLPAEHLNRTRIVYKDSKGHSVVTGDLNAKTNAGKSALIPITTAVNLQVSNAVLKDCTPVIVLSEVDNIYLNMMKSYLIENNMVSPELVMAPPVFITATESGVEGTAQILSKDKSLPCVYLEANGEMDSIADVLKSNVYSNQKEKIINTSNIGSFETLEDLIPYEIFAQSCGNYLVGIFGQEFAVRTSKPFIKQLEECKHVKPLPSNYRLVMAEMTVDYIERNKKKLKSLKNAARTWEKLFEKFIKVAKN